MDYDVYKQRLYRELNMSNSGKKKKKTIFQMFKQQLSKQEINQLIQLMIKDGILKEETFDKQVYLKQIM